MNGRNNVLAMQQDTTTHGTCSCACGDGGAARSGKAGVVCVGRLTMTAGAHLECR